MKSIIEVVLPLFALVAVGYAAARGGAIGRHGNQGLATFVYWFAVPVLLFRGVATRRPEELLDLRLLAAYALSTTLLFFGVRWLAGHRFALPREYAVFHGFGAAQSNNGFLAVPLMPALFGEGAIAPVALTLFSDMLFLYPLAFMLAGLASSRSKKPGELLRNVARTLYTNPFLLAMAAGLAVALTRLSLPSPVMAFATLLGQAGPPAALFALGASLALYSAGTGSAQQIGVMTIAKLGVHPLLLAVIGLWLIPLAPLQLTVGIAVAALPTGINLFLISQRYVANPGIYSAAILASTALSVLTFSGVVWLLTG